MFCSQCGKKLREGMLFCPFCGAEIVIPEQDVSAAPEPAADAGAKPMDELAPESAAPDDVRAQRPAAAEQPNRNGPETVFPDLRLDIPPESVPEQSSATENDAGEKPEEMDGAPLFEDSAVIYDVEETPETEPVSRETEGIAADWRNAFDDWLTDIPEERSTPEAAVQPREAVKPPTHRPPEGETVPVRRTRGASTAGRHRRRGAASRSGSSAEARRPSASSLSGGASRDTVVPRKRGRDDDLFMDAAAPPPEAYDRYDETFYDEDAVAEEERPSFLVRHLRSMVGLMLLALLAVIMGLYAISGPGQTNLAKLNLAWRPEVYSRLGKESYNVGQFQLAGAYYERALTRAPDNYGYASSAAKCYLDGRNVEKATEMLKRCIALMPTAEDPYVYLLGLYPDPVNRPLEITQILQQGYQMTGSERLKESAAGGS